MVKCLCGKEMEQVKGKVNFIHWNCDSCKRNNIKVKGEDNSCDFCGEKLEFANAKVSESQGDKNA